MIYNSWSRFCEFHAALQQRENPCLPWWLKEDGSAECPYGKYLWGDVTFPKNASVMDFIAVVYSFIPFAVVALVCVEFLLRRGTKELSVIMFACFSAASNEFVFKHLLLMPRPGFLGPGPGTLTDMNGNHVGSCARTCGMPSSHSTMSVGFMLLMLFDGLLRFASSVSSKKPEEPTEHTFMTRLRSFSAAPLAPEPGMTHSEYILYLSKWLILLAPVPMMRVALYDHSVSQVSVGSLLGAFYAVCWFQLAMFLAERHKDSFKQPVFYGFLYNNYAGYSFVNESKDTNETTEPDIGSELSARPVTV